MGKLWNLHCLLVRSFITIPQRPPWSPGSITGLCWRRFDSVSEITAGYCYNLPPALFLLLRLVLVLLSPRFLHSDMFQPCLSYSRRLKLQHITLSASVGGIQPVLQGWSLFPPIDFIVHVLRQPKLKGQFVYVLNLLLCGSMKPWPTCNLRKKKN